MEKQKEAKLLQILTFEVLGSERRNLRSKALTDQKMSEELQKVIIFDKDLNFTVDTHTGFEYKEEN